MITKGFSEIRLLVCCLTFLSPIVFIISCSSSGFKPDSDPILAIEASSSTLPINYADVNNSDLSGTYVSEFISNPPYSRMKQNLILHLNQNGNQITASDSGNTLRLTGELKGDVIYFEIQDSIGHSVNQHPTFGQWTILRDGGGLEGELRGKGGPYAGKWKLRKLENNGVELYTVATGLNQPFRIRESEKLFDLIFAPPNNQSVVFYIHGRGKAFEKEFKAPKVPYIEEHSNTRFIIIHWLSWGGASMRPYQHAIDSAPALADFLFAFNEYKSRKPGTVGDRNITLLAHSMGNIPLKVFLEELYEKQALQKGLLSSVILSNADVPIARHREWVEKIDFSDNIHIIQNQRDLVLSLSAFIGKDTPGGQGPKLGRGFGASTNTHIEDLANNAHYLDVTRSSSLGHQPFNMSSYPMDANATQLFKLLLNGQGFEFPDPSVGLYQIPEINPVFYFYSSNSLGDNALTETEEVQTQRMARYIELRANQISYEKVDSASDTSLYQQSTPTNASTQIDISGNYISDISSNKKEFFGNTDGNLVFTLEQNGDRITAINSAHNLKIGGTRKGNIIDFFVEPHRMNSFLDQNGVWEIYPDGINIMGSWQVINWRGNGQLNLRRIVLPANRLYSEEQLRLKTARANSSENMSGEKEDWKPAKGEWRTKWGSTNTRLKIIDGTRATYNYKNGRILFSSIEKNGKWEGYWIESSGSERSSCGIVMKDDSRYWGKVIFKFNDNYTRFRGTWDYCGEGRKMLWTGVR